MANYLKDHSLDTRPQKKLFLHLHFVTYLCQFMTQNSEIWGGQKNPTTF